MTILSTNLQVHEIKHRMWKHLCRHWLIPIK